MGLNSNHMDISAVYNNHGFGKRVCNSCIWIVASRCDTTPPGQQLEIG
jgi:hypothetical protein